MYPEPQPTPKRWPLSPKQTWLLIGGIVAVIIIIVVALLIGGSKSPESADNQAMYHDRAGYDRSKLSDAVADPFAVTFTKNANAVDYKGNKVIQACNLLSVDEITKQDLLIKANTAPTPISRTFNDSVGKGDYNQKIYTSSLSGSSLGKDMNNCHYVLEADEGVPAIDINVFQPFSVPSDVVAEEIQDNYTATGTVEELAVYTKKDSVTIGGDDITEYIVMQQGTGAFYLSLNLGNDNASKEQALLETAAKNFLREQTNPTGVSKLAYDSPIFPKSIVRACDLITNEHIRSLSGKDAGPLVREGIASSIAKIQFNTQDDQTPYLNVSNECTRGTTGGGSGLGSDGAGDLNLKAEVVSFLEDTPAKYSVDLQRQKNPNNRDSVDTPTKIGDGSVGYTDA